MEPTPQQLTQKRREFAEEYRDIMKELGTLRQRKAMAILKSKAEGVKSMAEAERLWEATQGGQREIQLHHESKGLELLISSLNSEIKILLAESFNQF